MKLESWQLAAFAFPALILLHSWVGPYTKVEESFNIQATHDILTYGVPTQNSELRFRAQYDHMTFPGAVPRTFVGALVLSGIAKPFKYYLQLDLLAQQYLVRAILGLLNASALVYYAYGVQRAFGNSTALWYILLQASQFHVFYYASRMIPNTFAVVLSTVAMRFFLPDPTSSMSNVKRTRLALYLSTIATIVFRAELALFLGSLCVHLITAAYLRNDSPSSLIRTTIIPPLLAATVAGLALTIPIDTYFWRQTLSPSHLLWPELSAFLANVFPPPGSHGASDWGTSPFFWYFTSAMPRLFVNPFILALFIATLTLPQLRPNTRSINFLIYPYLLYTLLYSFLPHKETRFIFPIIPPLTTALALSATRSSDRRGRYFTYKIITNILLISTLATAFLSHAILLPLAALTYPGAHALTSLHQIPTAYPPQRTINVHLSNLALQTGITRFLQYPPPRSPLVILPGSPDGKRPELRSGGTHWVYDKTDNHTGVYGDEAFWRQFDYVIVEHTEDALPVGGWDVVDTIHALGRPVLIGPSVGRGLLVMGDEDESPVVESCVGRDDERGLPRRGGSRHPDGMMRVLEAAYGEKLVGRAVVRLYGVVHDLLREGWGLGRRSLTKGWWVHWNMEKKLYVMKRRQGTPLDTQKNVLGVV